MNCCKLQSSESLGCSAVEQQAFVHFCKIHQWLLSVERIAGSPETGDNPSAVSRLPKDVSVFCLVVPSYATLCLRPSPPSRPYPGPATRSGKRPFWHVDPARSLITTNLRMSRNVGTQACAMAQATCKFCQLEMGISTSQ